MDWIIRPAAPADAAPLAELAERTFRDAFSDLNTAEDMDLYALSAYSPEIQSAEIANRAIVTLVSEAARELIAFAQIHLHSATPECVTVPSVVELHRFYVDRRFHGAGLAVELMERVLKAAGQHGAAAVWLGVWEKNPRAIRFYQRSGFLEAGDHTFLLGTDLQRDLVMVRGVS